MYTIHKSKFTEGKFVTQTLLKLSSLIKDGKLIFGIDILENSSTFMFISSISQESTKMMVKEQLHHINPLQEDGEALRG